MVHFTITKRNLFIDDDFIIERIGSSNIEFALHKDVSGETTLVAYKSELGRKVIFGKRVKMNTPAQLFNFVGESATLYTELIRPEPMEAFRIKLNDSKFVGGRTVMVEPRFTGGSIVIPQGYFNEYSDTMFYNGIGVRFRHTTIDTLKDGYVVVSIADMSEGKVYRDDSRLQQCGAGLRSCGIKAAVDFLELNAKNIINYKYEGTMGDLIFFKEKQWVEKST